MRRIVVPALVALLALAVVPAPAGAKGVDRAEICGADGCHDVAGNGREGHADSRFELLDWGHERRRPRTVGAHYVVRVFMRIDSEGGTHETVTRWFPDDRLLAVDGPTVGRARTMWARPGAAMVRTLQRATRGIPALSPRDVPPMVLDGAKPRPDPRVRFRAPPPSTGDGIASSWPLAAGGGLLLVAAAGALGRHRRRRRGPRAAPAPGR